MVKIRSNSTDGFVHPKISTEINPSVEFDRSKVFDRSNPTLPVLLLPSPCSFRADRAVAGLLNPGFSIEPNRFPFVLRPVLLCRYATEQSPFAGSFARVPRPSGWPAQRLSI